MNGFSIEMMLEHVALLWFLLGLVLMLVEFASRGVVAYFFAAGAWVSALAVWLELVGTDEVTTQLVVFGVSSVLLLILLRGTVKRWVVGDERVVDAGAQSEGLETQCVGQRVQVVELIPGGFMTGKVELRGEKWKAYADEEIEEGETVEVVSREGKSLQVRRG